MTRPRGVGGDGGASLVIVLIIVTVVSVVLGTVLSLIDTSLRTTVALADQASVGYGVDGAAQVAIKQLEAGTFAGNNCASATTMSLDNWIPADGAGQGASVAVACTPNPQNATGSGGANTSPGSALLTLGQGAGGEDGIWDGSVNNLTFKVSGGIFSNSNINLGNKSSGSGPSGNAKSVIENVATNSYVFALGACSGPGDILVHGATSKTCDYGSNPLAASDRRGMDPQTVPGHGVSFDPPAAPPATATTPPTCSGKKVYELQPGLYSDASLLNALTANGSCTGSIVHFNPGTYYFNFKNSGTHKWTNKSAYVVAGTPTGTLNVATPPAMTAANPSCVAPGKNGSSTSSGVLFVFGGDSRMDITQANNNDFGAVEICASNASSGPPVAVYGLKSAIGAGSARMPALTGCMVATPYVAGGDSTHCALIQTYSDNAPIFTVRGTVYAPTAAIDMNFNNASSQYFQWGLVARTISINSTGSSTALASNVISVPDDAPAPFPLPDIMYLTVYICPGQATCSSSSGTKSLQAKVQLSATTPTTASVLSWSNGS